MGALLVWTDIEQSFFVIDQRQLINWDAGDWKNMRLDAKRGVPQKHWWIQIRRMVKNIWILLLHPWNNHQCNKFCSIFRIWFLTNILRASIILNLSIFIALIFQNHLHIIYKLELSIFLLRFSAGLGTF